MEIFGLDDYVWSCDLDTVKIVQAEPDAVLRINILLNGTILAKFNIFTDHTGMAPLPLMDVVTSRMLALQVNHAVLQISAQFESQRVDIASDVILCLAPIELSVKNFTERSFMSTAPVYKVVPEDAEDKVTILDTELKDEYEIIVKGIFSKDVDGRQLQIVKSDVLTLDKKGATSFAEFSVRQLREVMNGKAPEGFFLNAVTASCGRRVKSFYFVRNMDLTRLDFLNEFGIKENLYIPVLFKRVAKLSASKVVTASGDNITADRMVSEELSANVALDISTAEWLSRQAEMEMMRIDNSQYHDLLVSIIDLEITISGQNTAEIKLTLTPVKDVPSLPFNPALYEDRERVFTNPFNLNFS